MTTHTAGAANTEGFLQCERQVRELEIDTRTTLLDALREHCISPAPRRAAITASAAPAR